MRQNEGCIVLGAAGSLGKAVVVSLKEMFPVTLLFDKEVSDEINFCDLSAPESINQAISIIPFERAIFWRLLICAGSYHGSNSEQDWSLIRQSLEINLIGIAHFLTCFTEKVRTKNLGGRVVIVSSAASRVGSLDLGYGIAKAGQEGVVRSFSKRFAKDGVTFMGISPGIFASRMSDSQSYERRQAAIAATHIKRIGRIDEIVTCVCFALVDAPDYLTGTFIFPTGGQIT